MTWRNIAPALIAAAVALGVGRTAAAASIDPLLLPVLSGHAAPDASGDIAIGMTTDGAPRQSDLLSVSLRVVGPFDELRALGIHFGGTLGDVATAEVTPDQLRLLATHPSIRSIEASRSLRFNLDLSAPKTGVSGLRNRDNDGWTPTSYTGRGVLIGIIDSGLDLSHDDFLASDGATRALAVWDQSSSVGRPPRGFSYGAECTAQQINARDCPEVDREGHGTHVAGIAAGDGSATGQDRPAYQYIGMAPEADLLVVKLRSGNTTNVIDALAYLRDKATAFGKPLVVNMSLGSPLGPHDGTTDLEQAINTLSTEGIVPRDATRPLGAVVVAAAGNSGQIPNGSPPARLGTPLHAVGCFGTTTTCPPGITAHSGPTPAVVTFVVPGDVPGLPDTVRVDLDVWYPGTTVVGLTVAQSAAGCSAGPVSLSGTSSADVATPCGNILISAADTQSNGDRRTSVVITHPTRISPGIWTLSLSPDAVTDPTRFDVWSDSVPTDNKVGFSSFFNRETTIEMPASAAEAIAVVPYITKTVWVSIIADCCGINTDRHGDLNGLAAYASRGPLRQCTFCDPPPRKPELAAPGLAVKSGFSSRIPDDPALDNYLDPDRRHYVLMGSSMAAPHVAGAAAILLQINRHLTAAQIKTYLVNSAAAPEISPVPSLPSTQWGAGRLAIDAAVAELKRLGGDLPPAAPTGLDVTSVHSRRVALAWSGSPDLDLMEYRILRRVEGDPAPASLYRTVDPTATTFEDVDADNLGFLQNETAYLYSLQAVDITGQAGPISLETRAVPTAGEGSVGFCFIATAAYGSAWHPHVASLRTFRDHRLRPFAVGRAAISIYETISPPIAAFIAPRPLLRAVTRGALTPIVFAVESPRAAFALIGFSLLAAATITLRRRAA
ncbi:MAG: S8 family serine peptidase [Nitrospirota bacterium]